MTPIISINPGKPAVTETRVVEVEPATPETVTLTLTPGQALAVYKMVNYSHSSATQVSDFRNFGAVDASRAQDVWLAMYYQGFRQD